MCPTLADGLNLVVKATQIHELNSEVQRQILAWGDASWQAAVAILEGSSDPGHTANNSGQLLSQCIDQAVAPRTTSTAKPVALTVDDDVKHIALVPSSR